MPARGVALAKRGLGKGDTVAILSANTAEMFEAHFAVPMMWGFERHQYAFDAKTVAFILEHGEEVIAADKEFGPLAEAALAMVGAHCPQLCMHRRYTLRNRYRWAKLR